VTHSETPAHAFERNRKHRVEPIGFLAVFHPHFEAVDPFEEAAGFGTVAVEP
jgi:hypothetical protein